MRRILTVVLVLAAAPAPLAGETRIYRDLHCTGTAVTAPPPSPEVRRGLETKLAEARAQYAKNPNDADAIIWLGRRTAYLGRFDEAVRIFSEGVRKHPRDARMYRHRGHRYITLRCFGLAVKDLKRAAELVEGKADETEPDGLPNARGIPTSTTNSNIFYHLGLAYYLEGDFKSALRAYRECLKFSKNSDMLAATAHWLYMTLRRLGRVEEAAEVLALVRDDAEIIENQDYQRLLLMYKGRLKPEELLAEAEKQEGSLGFASTGFGVGNWYLYNGEREKALRTFLRVVGGPQQTSFGYIAAEAELRRMGLKNFQRGLPLRTIR